VADAFLSMFTLQRACEIQIMAQAGGAPLVAISDGIPSGIGAQAKQSLGDSGAGRAWPAIMRKMDRLDPSYRN
jgi:hypothetical protein